MWIQIVSDITGIEQYVPVQQIGASYGDALLAEAGVGLFGSMSDAARLVKIKQVVQPDTAMHRAYTKYYQIYRELYTCNAPLMHFPSAVARGE